MSLVSSRRTNLAGLQNLEVKRCSHAGLWLDKYMEKVQVRSESLGRDESDPRQEVLRQAAAIPVSKAYRSFYARWQATLTELGATCKLAQAQGRIAIGLGNESVQETAISLHRTYGVPYLPGSALKGLAAHFAAMRLGDTWARDREAYRIVFGDTKQAGYITFFDAYPEPPKSDKPEDRLLHPDIMAIHHFDYYQGQNAAPADWDDPNMVHFPTATGRYLVALAGPPEWVKTAFLIVGYALEEMGIGAKTSSGYGRMVLAGMEHKVTSSAIETEQVKKASSETYEQAKTRFLKESAAADRQRGAVHEVQGNHGFILPARGGSKIFVHRNDLRSQEPLRNGQVVEFRLVPGKPNPKAVDVVILLQPAG